MLKINKVKNMTTIYLVYFSQSFSFTYWPHGYFDVYNSCCSFDKTFGVVRNNRTHRVFEVAYKNPQRSMCNLFRYVRGLE